MSQLTFQNCSACEATAAQWARANAFPDSKQDLSSPGKPYPIPPTFGSESHPYARQIGDTQIMTVPEPEAQQKKVWIQPEYNVVVQQTIDMDYVKELISNILPPALKSESIAPMPPRPNVPTPPGVPPRHRLSCLEMEGTIPPPRPYVPTPPYESLLSFNPVGVLPNPRPNVPLPPDAPLTQSLSGPPPRPYVPTPPYDHPFGFNTESLLPNPRPNVPLPPDAPPTQRISGPTPRPNVPLPLDALLNE